MWRSLWRSGKLWFHSGGADPDGCTAGIYVGDGIYVRGSDEPVPYGPTVKFGHGVYGD